MHGLALNAGAASLSSAVLYKDQLVVAGIVGLAGSPPEWKPIRSPVRWDGQGWQSLANGSPCPTKLAVVGDDLIAGGFYGIARWDGSAWHSMGSGLTGMFIAIKSYKGKIYAGGELRIEATGQKMTLASFDGTEWSEVPNAPATAEWNTPRVAALEEKDGLLYVGGNFEGPQSIVSPGVAAWDGTRWHRVGAGVPGYVEALANYHDDLYAGGPGLLRWDGFTWTSMGLDCQVLSLGRYGDRLIVGGNAGVDRFVPGSMGLVSWNGESWGGFGSGVNGQVYGIQQIGGDLYVAGTFSSAGDQSSYSVARWGGSEPLPVPPGVQPPGGDVALSFGVESAVVTSNQAQLSFWLPESGPARLELYDVRGARVATLRSGTADAGRTQLAWSSGSPVSFPQNGVYFLRLIANGKTANGKVIFAR
jgi:hypothetical protein